MIRIAFLNVFVALMIVVATFLASGAYLNIVEFCSTTTIEGVC